MYTGARIQGRLALPLCDLFPDFTFVPGAWRQPAHSTPLALLSRYFLSSYLSTTCADHDDNAQLTAILSHHVVGEQLDPTAVVGEHDTLNGDTVTVEGDESGMTVDGGAANVICGNVPTANATVYIIDSVLMPTK